MSDKSDKVINYLRMIGKVEYKEPDFSDLSRIDYATIRLATKEAIAGPLEDYLIKTLTEQAGFTGFARFIGYSEIEKGKHLYAIDLIPFDKPDLENDAKIEYLTEATDKLLQRLPKVFSNFRHKYPSEERGR